MRTNFLTAALACCVALLVIGCAYEAPKPHDNRKPKCEDGECEPKKVSVGCPCGFCECAKCECGFVAFQEKAEVKVIEAQEIKLTSPDGKRSITISAKNDRAGIWIDSDKGPTIALFDTKAHAGIGIYAANRKDPAMSIALSVDRNGDPFIQFIQGDGKIKMFSPFDAKPVEEEAKPGFEVAFQEKAETLPKLPGLPTEGLFNVKFPDKLPPLTVTHDHRFSFTGGADTTILMAAGILGIAIVIGSLVGAMRPSGSA